jgi:hypothetical protein
MALACRDVLIIRAAAGELAASADLSTCGSKAIPHLLFK